MGNQVTVERSTQRSPYIVKKQTTKTRQHYQAVKPMNCDVYDTPPVSSHTTPDTTPDIRPLSPSSVPPPLLRLNAYQYSPTNKYNRPPLAYQVASTIENMMTSQKLINNYTKPILMSIEGNIGSGKSTLLHKLKTYKPLHRFQSEMERPIVFVDEPVSMWETVHNPVSMKNIIEEFYSHPDEHAFAFQMLACITRMSNIIETVEKYPNAIIITERSLDTDKYVFAMNLHRQGYIKDIHYQIYQLCHRLIGQVSKLVIDRYIYVCTEPTLCMTRIQKRRRDGENEITQEYLNECHEAHENWLSMKTNVATINGNIEFETDEATFNHILENVIPLFHPEIPPQQILTTWQEFHKHDTLTHKPNPAYSITTNEFEIMKEKIISSC